MNKQPRLVKRPTEKRQLDPLMAEQIRAMIQEEVQAQIPEAVALAIQKDHQFLMELRAGLGTVMAAIGKQLGVKGR